MTSHISHIYKGINAMLIIRGPIKPYTFWIKIILAIFLAKTRPDQTIFSALTNLTIDFDFELSKIYKCWIRSVYFVLSYLLLLISWWQVERFASWSWSENPDDCKLWLHAPSPETRLVRCTLSGPRIQRKLQIFQMRPISDPCIANTKPGTYKSVQWIWLMMERGRLKELS